MASCTIFKNFNVTVEDRSLIVIVNDIIQGKYKTEIEILRSLLQQGKKEEADKRKKGLPAFTPSARFKGGRKMEYLVIYSQFIILDLDHLSSDELETAFQKTTLIPYTFSCFRSPSGLGLKILVEVTTDLQMHEQAYNQVADFYQEQLQLPIDRSGKDVTRLCFVSYDPQAYKCINNQKFVVTSKEEDAITKPVQLPADDKLSSPYDELFQKCIAFTKQKSQYTEHNRNNYIYLLACNCNRTGIPEEDALQLCLANYDKDPKEVKASVESAYKNNGNEHGKFAGVKHVAAAEQEKPDPDEELLLMPYIPADVFNYLPQLLLDGCNAFETERERDIFLTGALTILSGCFTSVEGTYDQKTVYPNLNCFVIAPAASGKGALVFAKQLGQAYHDQLLKESLEAIKQYQVALQQYKNSLKHRKRNDPPTEEDEPEKPPFKILFIPGNSSSAAVIRHLMEGEEKGIFCETEADTMGNSFKQDWGGYSDLLRKAFHHESISYSRKTNDEYFEIKRPRLSVALSGTPSQVQSLISSAEDGLFSRFIFYTFKVKPEWRNVAPNAGKPNLTRHFETLSLQVHQIVTFLEQHPSEFHLTADQWQQLNDRFKLWLQEVSLFVSEEASSTVKRLGLIVYRLAMVLTALRKFENGDMSRDITCEDADFSIAFKLAEVFKQHAIFMFTRLPKSESISDKKVKQFFGALPDEFQRKEAVAIGITVKVQERTVDKYLAQLLEGGFLTQPDFGKYKKA